MKDTLLLQNVRFYLNNILVQLLNKVNSLSKSKDLQMELIKNQANKVFIPNFNHKKSKYKFKFSSFYY